MKQFEYNGARYVSHTPLNCSQYGNPRARVVFETKGGARLVATTATDAAAGYAVGNWALSGRASVVVHWTRAGNAIIDYIREWKRKGARHV